VVDARLPAASTAPPGTDRGRPRHNAYQVGNSSAVGLPGTRCGVPKVRLTRPLRSALHMAS
jgi:hypothetical protein